MARVRIGDEGRRILNIALQKYEVEVSEIVDQIVSAASRMGRRPEDLIPEELSEELEWIQGSFAMIRGSSDTPARFGGVRAYDQNLATVRSALTLYLEDLIAEADALDRDPLSAPEAKQLVEDEIALINRDMQRVWGNYPASAALHRLQERREAKRKAAMENEHEAMRDRILGQIFEHEGTDTPQLVPLDTITGGLHLSIEDARYHLDILRTEGYVESGGGGANPRFLLTTSGRQRVREGVRRPQTGGVTVGAIINTMTGGTVQAVGSASNTQISQVVNDPC